MARNMRDTWCPVTAFPGRQLPRHACEPLSRIGRKKIQRDCAASRKVAPSAV